MLKKINLNRISYILFLIVSLFTSVIFTYYYFLYTHEYPPGSAEKIASLKADKVFQTRLLIPVFAKFISPIIPVLESLFQWLVPYPIDYQVLLQLINMFSLLMLLISIPILLNCLGCYPNHWMALIILIPLSWNYIFINGYIDGAGLYYSYDIPSLAFYSIGLILFLKQKWIFFYIIFTFACLNRESSCFISISGFLLLSSFKSFKPKYFIINNLTLLIHITLQFIIWICLRLILSYSFRYNPGEFFEQPHSMLQFISCIWNNQQHWAMQDATWFLTLFLGLWIIPILLFKKLNTKARLLSIVGIFYLIALFFRSNMMETRVYNELNVILTLCTIICLHNCYFKSATDCEVDYS